MYSSLSIVFHLKWNRLKMLRGNITVGEKKKKKWNSDESGAKILPSRNIGHKHHS